MTNLPKSTVRGLALPLILLATLALGNCSGGKTDQEAVTNESAAVGSAALTPDQEALVLKAAAIAVAIAAAPDNASTVLSDNNLTADEYEALIYRISADPVLARAYEAARRE